MNNPSVLDELQPLIRKWLEFRHGSKAEARKILQRDTKPPPLEEWIRTIRMQGTNNSTELWKWRCVPEYDLENTSEEKILEKAVAGLLSERGWANQIVAASGLSRNRGDGHRNIDLGHRVGDGTYRLIELKIDSDNPVFAAVELLEYALLYWWSRQHPEYHKRGREDVGLLSAKFISMEVLAPRDYYNRFDPVLLRKFAGVLTEAYNRLTKGALVVEFRFCVLVLPQYRGPWRQDVLEEGFMAPPLL